MPLILQIESSTEVCSVCISQDGNIISIQESAEHQAHASQITLLIQACLEEANIEITALDGVAVSAGPGSYTGLRIGVSSAKGICYALNKPLIAVDTLQALANATAIEVQKEALYCPMIDARRMEVYAAFFSAKNERLTEVQSYLVDSHTFKEYFSSGQMIVFSGNGSHKCRKLIDSELAIFHPIICSAKHLVPIAEQSFRKELFADVAYFSPNYFKAPNITISKKTI